MRSPRAIGFGEALDAERPAQVSAEDEGEPEELRELVQRLVVRGGRLPQGYRPPVAIDDAVPASQRLAQREGKVAPGDPLPVGLVRDDVAKAGIVGERVDQQWHDVFDVDVGEGSGGHASGSKTSWPVWTEARGAFKFGLPHTAAVGTFSPLPEPDSPRH